MHITPKKKTVMTAIEIEAQKASLVRQILTEINTEEDIRKVSDFLQQIQAENPYAISPELLHQLMEQARLEDENGLCVSSHEMDDEISSW